MVSARGRRGVERPSTSATRSFSLRISSCSRSCACLSPLQPSSALFRNPSSAVALLSLPSPSLLSCEMTLCWAAISLCSSLSPLSAPLLCSSLSSLTKATSTSTARLLALSSCNLRSKLSSPSSCLAGGGSGGGGEECGKIGQRHPEQRKAHIPTHPSRSPNQAPPQLYTLSPTQNPSHPSPAFARQAQPPPPLHPRFLTPLYPAHLPPLSHYEATLLPKPTRSHLQQPPPPRLPPSLPRPAWGA